jgi:DNA-binding response OmpR family regulator
MILYRDNILNHKTMKKILIIEDELDLREALLSRFLSEGYQAIATESAGTGLSLVVEYRPDIILLDILTPSMHGGVFISLLRGLPDNVGDCKVIVLTNLDNEVTREKVGAFNVDGYLVKAEVSLDQVVAKVREVLETNNPDIV